MLLWFVQSAHRSNSSGQQWQLLLLQFCTFFLVSNRTEQFSPNIRSLFNQARIIIFGVTLEQLPCAHTCYGP